MNKILIYLTVIVIFIYFYTFIICIKYMIPVTY